MTRLERYLAREAIPALFIGAALYVGLFLVQSLLGRSQYLSALPAGAVLRWLGYQVPNFAVQALPLATVLMVLLVFGRMARDRELLAVQAAGVSLARLVRPVVVLAVCLVVASLALTEYVVPWANQRTAVTWWESIGPGGQALGYVAGKQLAVGPYQLFFSGYDAASRELTGVRLESWQGRVQTVFFASSARLERDLLTLRGYVGHGVDFSRLPLPEGADPASALADLVTLSTAGARPADELQIKLPQNRDEIIARNTEGGFESPKSLSTLYDEWRAARGPAIRTAGVEFSTRAAVPFANLAILLLAIPVAASAARSTGVAFGLALVIAVGYYLALFFGRLLSLQGVVPPVAGPWLGNLAFIVAGIWFVRRQQGR